MGFEKVIIREGDGSKPVKGREVTVHCTGYGKNNDLNVPFWSTKDPGQKPFSFAIGLGNVIKGWDECVMTMVSLLQLLFIAATLQFTHHLTSCFHLLLLIDKR